MCQQVAVWVYTDAAGQLFQHQPQVGAKAPAESAQMVRTCKVNTHFQVYAQKC